MFYYLTLNGTKIGDNVVFAREPGNSFNPSRVKVGPFAGVVYTFLLIIMKGSHVYYKSVSDTARKLARASAVYFAYYIIIT